MLASAWLVFLIHVLFEEFFAKLNSVEHLDKMTTKMLDYGPHL